MKNVRIIVSEAFEWNSKNLFGSIIKQKGNEYLLIELSNPIKIENFSSKIIELKPLHKSSNFKNLINNYSVNIIGNIINEETKEIKFIFTGIVTYD